MINTFAHMPGIPGGYRRYEVTDRSVNRPIIALFTLGAGYHNNHHRQGKPWAGGIRLVRS